MSDILYQIYYMWQNSPTSWRVLPYIIHLARFICHIVGEFCQINTKATFRRLLPDITYLYSWLLSPTAVFPRSKSNYKTGKLCMTKLKGYYKTGKVLPNRESIRTRALQASLKGQNVFFRAWQKLAIKCCDGRILCIKQFDTSDISGHARGAQTINQIYAALE